MKARGRHPHADRPRRSVRLAWPLTLGAVQTLELIDELDEIVRRAKPVPLTDLVRVDGEEIRRILSRMRTAVPRDVRGAAWGRPEGGDREALVAAVTAAVETVLRENIPAIAQAAAAAARDASPPPPPGGPF
jgi:hypothetical protein